MADLAPEQVLREQERAMLNTPPLERMDDETVENLEWIRRASATIEA